MRSFHHVPLRRDKWQVSRLREVREWNFPMRRWPRWDHSCVKPLCKSKWHCGAGSSSDLHRKDQAKQIATHLASSRHMQSTHETIKGTRKPTFIFAKPCRTYSPYLPDVSSKFNIIFIACLKRCVVSLANVAWHSRGHYTCPMCSNIAGTRSQRTKLENT